VAPGSLEVSVGTGTPATPPQGEATGSLGHGLVGLQERVAMYDGTLVAHATPEGGFLLRARFPL
jgi:signal transduction histidine kinase